MLETAACITYRAAVADDSNAIAAFICLAGHGLYEFLFDGLIPFVSAVDILSAGVARENTPVSYRHCLVAVDAASGTLVGAANVFPAALLREESYRLLPPGRAQHVEAMVNLQDYASMFVNALAVAGSHRGQGIGSRFLAWAEQRAREAGLDRVSLHVWADNAAARRLYARHGFVEIATAPVAEHPRLRHVGGSILMCKQLAAARPLA